MGIAKKTYKKVFWIVFLIIFVTVTIVVGKIIFDSVYPLSFDKSGISKSQQQQDKTTEVPTQPEVNSPIRIQWSQQLNSPPGGDYWSIAIAPSDPNTVLIASRSFNVLKSSNAGASWNLLGEKLFGAHILSNIVVHPTNPNRIIISNGALLFTEDGGTVWEAVNKYGNVQIAETEGVNALAIDDNNPDIVYAGQGNEFYQSSDFGKTWKKLSEVSEIVGSTIRGIIVVSDSIYVMNDGSGLWKSIDNGRTFAAVEEVVSSTFTYNHLFHDKTNNNIYVAATDSLYKNSGSGWNKLPQFNSEMQPIAVSAVGDIVYVTATDKSVYKSEDRGNSWAKVLTVNDIQAHDKYTFPVAVHPDFPDIVYVATDDQILKSIDSGKTWQDIGKDVKDDALFTMGYAKDTNTLWVGNGWTRGVFTTKDEGMTWNYLEKWRERDHYPMNIQIDPRNGRKVFISSVSGIQLTENNGETWSLLGEGLYLFEKHVHGLTMDPSDPDTLYAGTGPGWDQVNPVAKIYKTTDGGNTWRELEEGLPDIQERAGNNAYAFAVSESNPRVVYLAFNGAEEYRAPYPTSLGLFKSVNGGESWIEINNNLPQRNVFPVAVHPKNPDVVYIGLGHTQEHETSQGLYKSINGGQSWLEVNGLPQLQPSQIRFYPQNPNIILVSFGEHICGACGAEIDQDENNYPKGAGLWGSVDGGNTWHNLVPEGTFTKRQMAVMDVIFIDDDTVYIITDDGLFKGEIEINL